MSASELAEHLSYWDDDVKVAAYRAALDEVVAEGDDVLDLGTGTGLLGMLAARAGAGRVFSYDRGSIIVAAEHLARSNGLGDRIEFVRAFTTEAELPEVDVVVCDQIGGLAFDAGVLEFFADARRRSLRPGGRMVPASFDLFLAPVHAPELHRRITAWSPDRHGFDLATFRGHAANTQYAVQPEDFELAAPGSRFASIASHDDSPIRGQCSWTAEATKPVHGLVGWFDAAMSPSVRLTNDPGKADRMRRWLNFYPLAAPVEAAPGTKLWAQIDIRPQGRMVTWRFQVDDGPTSTQSTFFGAFEPVAENVRRRKSPTGEHDAGAGSSERRRDLVRDLLLMDEEGMPVADIVAACRARQDIFPTEQAATEFAHRFLRLV